MNGNLSEYVSNISPISGTKLLSEIECASIARRLVGREDKWENRSPIDGFFMSYGTLSYLDAKKDLNIDPEYDKFRGNSELNYKDKSTYFNELLMLDFYWLYDKIWYYYQEKFNKQVVFQKALPGFHIFQNPEQINCEQARKHATIHLDKPHLLHEWPGPVISASSFTIAIELPKCTAGLNIWRDDSIFKNINTVFYYKMSKEDQINIDANVEYYPYKLGYIYEQSGLLRHQITINGDVLEGERRVTMQGHLVEVGDKIVIYV
jgi:hypothetical protein